MAQTGEISKLLSSTTPAASFKQVVGAVTSLSFLDSQLSSLNQTEPFNFAMLNTTTPADPLLSDSVSKTVVVLMLTSLLTIGCILGNGLVILSIVLVETLQKSWNYLIISLAVSDILVGVVVMPLAIVYEVLGGWPLGYTACVFWVTSDVTLSTSSILNLLMISVDRYLIITKPLKYTQLRTGKFMVIYITVAWSLSLIISTTPLLASWFPDQGPNNNWCMVNQKIEYQMYATLGAFYLPLTIMIALYGKIYLITRKFLKMEAKNNPHPVNMDDDEENNEETHFSTNSSETSSEKIPISQNNNTMHKKNMLAASTGQTQAVDKHLALPLDHNHHHNGSGGSHHYQKKSAIHNNPHNSHLLHPDHSSEHRHGSGPLKRFSVATIASIRKLMHRSHKNHSQAVRTLGVIMGLFCMCWLPFFILAVIAPICGDRCEVPKWVWGLLTWLGYANSCFNPIVYARFNREFRTPFKEIICCRCAKTNEAVRHLNYMYQFGEET